MSDLNDPRVFFAAERTLLAWNRTSLAFTLDRCGVPKTAAALSLNLTVTGGTDASGDLRVVPGGRPLPFASTINYGRGQVRANNAIVKLGALGDLQIWCDQQAGSNYFILDVNGYFAVPPPPIPTPTAVPTAG